MYPDILLGSTLVFGRHTGLPQAQRLFHSAISREHCVIELLNPHPKLGIKAHRGEQVEEGVKSDSPTASDVRPVHVLHAVGRNPTFVNGVLLGTGGTRKLQEGDVIEFLETQQGQREPGQQPSQTPPLTPSSRHKRSRSDDSSSVASEDLLATPKVPLDGSSTPRPSARKHAPLPAFAVVRRSPSPEVTSASVRRSISRV